MQVSSLKCVLGLAVSLLVSAAPSAFGAEYLVKFKNQSGLKVSQQSMSIAGERVLKIQSKAQIATVDVKGNNQTERAIRIAKLLAQPNVEYVVPNFKLHSFEIPNDPEIEKQWSVEKVKASQAWDIQPGSKDIVIAVIDTGVDASHEDLKDNIFVNSKEVAGNGKDDDGNGFVDDVSGWDFFEDDADPMDVIQEGANPGHGTHCAGIIGGVGNNGTGISGMAQSISIMPLRFLGPDGSGDLNKAIAAIDYAVANGAHVISASWGATVPADMAKPLIEAIERADKAGVIFVAAAANDGKNNDATSVFPANTPTKNVISVAASNKDDGKPQWSNYGLGTVDLASPGENIHSTLPDNKYGPLSGTSMATPLVSGLVGLMLSQNKDLIKNGQAVQSLLQTSGQSVDIETACKCRVDAQKAVEFARDLPLTVVPAAATLEKEGTLQFTGIGGKGPYTFTSSNEAVASVTAEGALTAKDIGEVKVTIKDSEGKEAGSLPIRIAEKEEAGADCPLGDPMLCTLICAIDPTLPWCSGGNGGGGLPELPGLPGLPGKN